MTDAPVGSVYLFKVFVSDQKRSRTPASVPTRTIPAMPRYGRRRRYVRHLILECASECGLTVDDSPIRLEDGREGLWEEAFITSSSRLIYPIEKILIPDYTNGEREDEGESGYDLGVGRGGNCDDGEEEDGAKGGKMKWKTFWQCSKRHDDDSEYQSHRLLQEIMKYGGYTYE